MGSGSAGLVGEGLEKEGEIEEDKGKIWIFVSSEAVAM